MEITIPDELLLNVRLSVMDIESELKKELGIALYARGLASLGISRKISGLNKWEFLEELASRAIIRHYTLQELEEDWKYACNQ